MNDKEVHYPQAIKLFKHIKLFDSLSKTATENRDVQAASGALSLSKSIGLSNAIITKFETLVATLKEEAATQYTLQDAVKAKDLERVRKALEVALRLV